MTTAAVDDLFRVYLDPAEIGKDGYPYAWHRPCPHHVSGKVGSLDAISEVFPAIKDLVRERDGHRCLRCGHPYRKGEHGNGEWSACDDECDHAGPFRWKFPEEPEWSLEEKHWPIMDSAHATVEAKWRILTVHHLNGVKHDCRWWNLTSLCQRCHLTVQGKVYMDRPYRREHSTWFKPFAAAYYASSILGEELSRAQVDARLDELLELQFTEPSLF